MDALDRMYARLVDALRREHPDSMDRPVTISEIYQNLVPYRAVRSELGFSELAEYEHTLLRLLAGEHGYANVELPQVREDLRRELRSANPILGLYRDYAAVEVRIQTDGAVAEPSEDQPVSEPPIAASPPPPPVRGTAVPTSEPDEWKVPELPARPPRPAAPAPAARPSPSASPRTPTPTVARTAPRPSATSSCRACSEQLPDIGGWEVRYCPFCGQSQKPVPCRECGTPLEPDWKFCIQCGTSRRVDVAGIS